MRLLCDKRALSRPLCLWARCVLVRYNLFTSSLLFRADPFGWGQPPRLILLPSWGHLDAHFHRNSPSSQLQWPGPRRDGKAHNPASCPRFGEGPQSANGPPAQTALVLDENQDITQREVSLALAAGQEVMLSRCSPPRARGGQLRRWRSCPWVMIGLCCRNKKGKVKDVSQWCYFKKDRSKIVRAKYREVKGKNTQRV